ncbi:hypothetical protein LIER_08236 [Lithospermum erythrorhizon]|uniref:Uncharacterized protein n=1 Tax=Lithospermum erythrorhizon TaxID=34254 RepID=A0AAV3PCI9_LITER
MKSVVVKCHLRDHYSISPKVQMWVPPEGETVDVPLEEGYTLVFWELFNYGMRLRASPFVNSLLSAIGRAPGQLGPFRESLPSGHSVCAPFGSEGEFSEGTLDFEKIKAELSEPRSQLDSCFIENESLNSLLFFAENSAASAVEDFKGSSEYVELLKGNTATLLRDFFQKVSSEFPGISSHFQKYVSRLGDKYVVDLFDDIPNDDDEDVGADEGG